MSQIDLAYSKVAIVILNWNGKHFLEKFLPKLIEYSLHEDVKIYIADNGSTDGSISFLQQFYPQLVLIQYPENYGFTGGYNKALELIQAKYFIILNSDVEVTENWINPVIDFMDKRDDVAACQPKIRSYAQKDHFEYAGAAGGFIDKYGYPFCRGRILKEHEIDSAQYNELDEIFWATGACMFVRAESFKLVGGFDEDFFAHMEEIDLCWQFKNNGFKIFYVPNSTVFHVGGGTLPNDNPKKLFLNYRNNLYLLYKNLNRKQLFITLFKRMVLDGISAILYLLGFKFYLFLIVFKAHLKFYQMIPKLHKKRKKNLLMLNQFNEIYPRSIVFDYFVKKRHYFSDLNFRR